MDKHITYYIIYVMLGQVHTLPVFSNTEWIFNSQCHFRTFVYVTKLQQTFHTEKQVY